MATRISIYLLFSIALFWACGPNASTEESEQSQSDTSQGLIADSAIVVSAHPIASQVGVDIMKQGGNAIDAAVAVHFALAVVYPRAGNIGGGGFMVYRASIGDAFTLDYREKAPALAFRDMFVDDSGKVNRDLSLSSLLASGVPGSVEGMWQAHQRFGKMEWQYLIQPSIDLAQNGFALTAQEANLLNEKGDHLEDLNGPNLYVRGGDWEAGDSIFMPELAMLLRSVRDSGRKGYYEAYPADSLHQQMINGGGLIRKQDLVDYQAVWREPIRYSWDEYELISMGPPSSGGILIAMMLEMVKAYDLSEMGFQSTSYSHLLAEVERRAYADRSAHLGDMDFWPVPTEGLMDVQYLAERMADSNPAMAGKSNSITPGFPKESEETTHFCVVDPQGNAVSITTTLNGNFGSGILASGGSYFLNNEMDDFSAKPGEPNYYGLIGGEANAIEPGKRMLSSMSPSIVTKNDSLYIILGTPGGSTIITTVFQGILNITEFGMGAQEATDAPRFHHQWLPDRILAEPAAFNDEVREDLGQMGHGIEERAEIGRMEIIKVLNNGKLEGGADPRGDDAAKGY
jgi:gamma-glutamyltranspeptidase/glutathione hydrolase